MLLLASVHENSDEYRDMANIELDWEVEGIIQADESIRGMLQVIDSKGRNDTGTFWCWDGRVCIAVATEEHDDILTLVQEHPW